MRLLLVGESAYRNQFEILEPGKKPLTPGKIRFPDVGGLPSWAFDLIEHDNYLYIAVVCAKPRQAGFYQDADRRGVGWILLESRSAFGEEQKIGDPARLRVFCDRPRSNPLPIDVVFGRDGLQVGVIGRAFSSEARRIPGVVIHDNGYTAQDAREFEKRASADMSPDQEAWLESSLIASLGLYHGWPSQGDMTRFLGNSGPLRLLRPAAGWGIRRRSLALDSIDIPGMNPATVSLLMRRALKDTQPEVPRIDPEVKAAGDRFWSIMNVVTKKNGGRIPWGQLIKEFRVEPKVGKFRVSHHDIPQVLEWELNLRDSCDSFVPEYR